MVLSIAPLLESRVYVVGDVHGCRRELLLMLESFIARSLFTPKDTMVFLGDYIDRGEDSKGVIDTLLELRKGFPFVYFLLGNHEHLLWGYLNGAVSREHYEKCGGASCLLSYGADPSKGYQSHAALIPGTHMQFLDNLLAGVIVDNFVLVHAGVHPHRSLADQSIDDILWIREQFLNSSTILPQTVVFGHTPMRDVFYHLPWKIGIDTGLVYDNKLSVLELRSLQCFQIARGGNHVHGR